MFSRLASIVSRTAAALGLCAVVGALAACSQNPVTVNLHAMQSSGRVSFVCRGADNSPSGHKLDECPDYEAGTRHTIALVTQTVTNEVAVVDLAAASIVDIDRTTPGYSFLRVGAMPDAIVSTPGGAATFVGVKGQDKDNGIYALPSTCIMPPAAGEPARDLTTWPACHLTSKPGDMAVIIDSATVRDADNNDVQRASCAGDPQPKRTAMEATCPNADTTAEGGPVGRRKLLVALPNEHKLVLLDAQSLLDRAPGEFRECDVEATFPLDAEIPASYSQILPDDLKPVDSMCAPLTYAKPDMSALPTPGGMSALGDRVYVADTARPVVHVLDVKDPCSHTELLPLLPLSYEQPWRTVTTSRVAASPLSITTRFDVHDNNKEITRQKQFLYAIDQHDQAAASVMVFDLMQSESKDPNSRTPLIFPGSARQPYMPADRVRFNAPVNDVSFVLRDFPKSNGTGAGEFGLACEPDPSVSPGEPAALYRPNADFSDGARPINLRGMFGFALLSNGQIAVIDADDFDAPCRRPVSSNSSTTQEDSHGCIGDPISTPYTSGATPTVTNESSCHIVEPNRPRSGSLSISSSTNGLRAPSLRTFPQFTTPGSTISIDKQPRMMATDSQNPVDGAMPNPLPAQVSVNSQLYAHCTKETSASPPCDVTGSYTQLSIDPKDNQNSLTLPLVEPRSYAADQAPSLVFEGSLFPARSSGFLDFAEGASQGTLRDSDANFCGFGVEDSETIRARGVELGIPASSLDAWSEAHADYVQIAGDFPGTDDQYWTKGRGQECARDINPAKADVFGRDACLNKFGDIDNPLLLKTTRNLSILQATAGELQIKPQGCTGDNCATLATQIECCFPAGTAYTVRVANQWLVTGTGGVGMHDLATGPGNRCVHTASCDLRKEHYGQRVFEVCDPSAAPETHTVVDADGSTRQVQDFKCEATDPKVGCVAMDPMSKQPKLPVLPGDPAGKCIFENLTSRFVVYHGAQANIPNMAFNWQTTGGFVPQTMSLLSLSSSVSPQSLGYLPEQGWLAVVDASTVGLVLFDLNSLGVVSPSPYF